MTTALIIGHGQIGAEIAAQLSEAGIETRIATRSAKAALVDASPVQTATVEGPPTPLHVRADATDREQLRRAAEGADVIFACAHAAYDSPVWERILPALDAAVPTPQQNSASLSSSPNPSTASPDSKDR